MNERRGTKGLELWCRKMTEGYPGVKIDNMTTSWRDGLAFCAIIHHFRPDLIDFSKLNKDDVYHNNELAFRIAEQYLGIPALLEPEDMVEYTVPDRLSILTYLSQFYQAFAVREGGSPARTAPKRPQSSADHGIVSPASTSPPTKVAFTGAGKLRREPCTKCGLPVFIAERLNVGKSLFHRTCFRCARCRSQLTLANYYETENNEFCCEICPDEEKSMSKASAQKALLSRSMSDEEKSASLKMVSSEPDEFSAMFETALESADVEKLHTLSREFESVRSQFFQSQIESSDSGNDDKVAGPSTDECKDAEPPDLPESSPPKIDSSAQYDSGFPSKDNSVKNSFSNDLESQNVVTKDTSLVKARMRLFDRDKPKADVHNEPTPFVSIPSSIKNVEGISEDVEDTQHRGESPREEIRTITISDSSLVEDTSVSREEIVFVEEDSSKPDEAVEAINSAIASLEDPLDESKIHSIPDESFLQESRESESSIRHEEDSGDVVVETLNYNVKENSGNAIEETEEENCANALEVVEKIVEEAVEKSPVPKPEEPKIGDQPERVLVQETESNSSPPVPEKVEILSTPDAETNSSVCASEKETYPEDLNPFDEEEEEEEESMPKQSLNPFGSDDDDEEIEVVPIRRPVPSPRFKKKILDASDCREIWSSPLKDLNVQRISINPFDSDNDESSRGRGIVPPVPAARKKKISAPKISLNPFSSDDEENEVVPVPTPRNSRSSRLKEATGLLNANLNFGSNSSISSGSYYGSSRKKRPAPKPPIPAFLDDSNASSLTSTPSQSVQHSPKSATKHRKNRRAPPPPSFSSTPIHINRVEETFQSEHCQGDKKSRDELEIEKIIKDEANRNRQSQNLQNPLAKEEPGIPSIPNKSTYGQWKRKKGQAPPKPVPQKRTLKCLPMAEIRKELEFIEIQQQGLEKQGVRLEQIIREKCEGTSGTEAPSSDDDIPIEVEDLILQLFELVNEKNELFRKQTELMYLRRQQRLEEEHADVEYQIRCLMMQPEANKTDHDKTREEELIKRLVEIVERRNEIVECLEMDRVREAEEDSSINNHINMFTLSRENTDKSKEKPDKVKEKKKDKEKKKEKKSKNRSKDKGDVDKDVDETETVNTIERKKKKKFNLF